MTELSPQARAVKDAALAMYADCNVRKLAWPLDMPVVAAALRAAADQVLIRPGIPSGEYSLLMRMIDGQVRAIAAELEGQP